MKKLYLLPLIICLLLFQNVAFAQNNPLMKSPLQTDVRQAQARSAESSVQLGYCDDVIASSVGLGKGITLSGAIYITPEQAILYKNDQIKSIHVGLSSKLTKLSVFITQDLNGTNLVKQYVGTTPEGWKDVNLNTPYTITGEGFYIGYICTGDNQIGLSNLKSEYGTYVEISGKWQDYSERWGSLCIRVDVEGDNMPNDLSLISIENSIPKAGESFTLTGVVKSMTTVPVTSYEIKYTIGEETYAPQTFETVLKANMLDTFQIEVPPLSENGEYALQIAISKVNGKADDYEGNSIIQSIVKYKENVYPYKVVVEEGTATWCGFCPRGIVGVREMKKKYPDSFIGIAVHRDDPLEPTSYSPLFDNGILVGFPKCIVNRKTKHVFDPTFSNLEEAYLEEIDKGADVGITVTAQYTSEAQEVVAINTQTEFGYSAENATYSIAFVVTENEVTGYKQQNYYAGGERGAMGGFEDLPPLVNIVYDDIARGIYQSYAGTLNSLPTTIVKGETYTYSYELTLPAEIKNKGNLEIIALLIDSTTKEIVNADKVKLTALTDVEQVRECSDINVFAEDGIIKVNGDYDSMQVYTTEGMEIANLQLYSGIYLVRVVVGNHIYIKKIAL